jgi:hypothetical protein
MNKFPLQICTSSLVSWCSRNAFQLVLLYSHAGLKVLVVAPSNSATENNEACTCSSECVIVMDPQSRDPKRVPQECHQEDLKTASWALDELTAKIS